MSVDGNVLAVTGSPMSLRPTSSLEMRSIVSNVHSKQGRKVIKLR